MSIFTERKERLLKEYNDLISAKNTVAGVGNGIFDRYKNPVITAAHTPLFWRYDFNPETNPYFMERLGVNCAFNPGAIFHNGKYLLMVRVEGTDRKSFFAIAESDSPVDNFTFCDYPVTIPQTEDPDVNIYDMRLTKHEDGFIYGLFCTERKDESAGRGDTSSALAACGIIRTKDLKVWERLPDLKTKSPQQRNVVLHPEFIDGKYALYTRPQDGFIEAGKGGGICIAYVDSMENAVAEDEFLLDEKIYHTIKETKNGQGPPPIKTKDGWLHIAHGVRNTAAGLRYVLYAFMTSLQNPEKVIYAPGGHLIAPENKERVGDVSNVVFCNGMIESPDGKLYIYYASSDTRVHVASTTIEQMVDYCKNTPQDPLYTSKCTDVRNKLIEQNLKLIEGV